MLERPTIELRRVQGRTEADTVILDVEVFNPEERTLYAYASPRRILYDDTTGVLTVALHDQHIGPDHPIAPHLPEPRIEPLEPHATSHVVLTLPRVVRRVRSAQERQHGEDLVEELPIGRARRVVVEMAHQDSPYYYNPRAEKADQLREWGSQIARLETDVELSEGGPTTAG